MSDWDRLHRDAELEFSPVPDLSGALLFDTPPSETPRPARVSDVGVLASLRDRGLLSAEEFDTLRNRILARDTLSSSAALRCIFDAIFANDRQLLEDCLQVRPDAVNARTRTQGWTPLHFAVCEHNAEFVRLILQHGAYPDTPNAAGKTPLHHAAHRGLRQIVRHLLNYGADPGLRYKGKTARNRAAEQGHDDIVTLIDHYTPEPTRDVP